MATRMDLIKQAAPAAIKVFNRPAGCRVLLSQPLLFGGRFLHVACLPVAFFDQCGGLFFCGAAGLVGGFNGLSRRRLIAEEPLPLGPRGGQLSLRVFQTGAEAANAVADAGPLLFVSGQLCLMLRDRGYQAVGAVFER